MLSEWVRWGKLAVRKVVTSLEVVALGANVVPSSVSSGFL